MASGLTRSEQFALLGVGMFIVAGVVFQHFRDARSQALLAPPDMQWREFASVQAKPDSSAELIRKSLNDQLAGTNLSLYQSRAANAKTSATLTAGAPLDLNTATLDELDLLPGIGPVRARDILIAREMRKSFQSVDDLLEVEGIGKATLDKLRPFVRVENEPTTPPLAPAPQPINNTAIPTVVTTSGPPAQPVAININTADQTTLERIPGVGPSIAEKIITARRIRPFSRPEDLIMIKGIGPKTFEKMRPWVRVE